MTVVANEKVLCPFADLKPGDVFKCGYDYYMKIDADISEPNAVVLENGDTVKLGANLDVLPLNAKVIVE